jgi:nucleotide-binding universal stress UspA family protein
MTGWTVTAVYVARPAWGPMVAGGAALQVARQENAQALADDVHRWARKIFQELGVPFTFIATWGDPFTELCAVAKEIRADAVVVGASAHAAHRFVGSLAVRLVKAGKWPVTVVP